MKTNNAGIDLIKKWEGFRSDPYICSGGVWTIGFGATRLLDGRPIQKDTPPVTEQEGLDLLDRQLISYERSVNRLIPIEMNENEFSALVSFTYNLGSRSLKASTLRKLIIAGNNEKAADEFPKWCFAGGRKLRGLQLRRLDERRLFLS
tara:strand:+ start:3524 stop:3967 length:444 start_codon:yes stop_codon:yes gene_type:complete